MPSSSDPSRFTGKIAVITGAAQGIGEATARLFAARGAAGLLLTDRNRDKGEAVAASIRESGTPAQFITAELDDMAQVETIVPAADARFGQVDVLVNVAGLTDRGSVRDTRPALWERMFAINVRAPFFLMQAALKLMERDSIEGAIVNIISVNAHGGTSFLTPYSASKGALATLTKNFAHSVTNRRIKVNGIDLGWVDTPGEHATLQALSQRRRRLARAAEARPPLGPAAEARRGGACHRLPRQRKSPA